MESVAAKSPSLARVLEILVAILIAKVTASVLCDYYGYFPPNFETDFLRGRESYFWGGYSWAFYAHLATGPTSLLLGLVLISEQFRRRAPQWHRRLGRLQGVCVLLLAVSGLGMARYAATGSVAATGLGLLAVVTTSCILLGWKAAVARRFADHQHWMSRTFTLLCSAVVIRLIGGLATVAQVDAPWLYPLATWASWLVPLAGLEMSRLSCRR